MLYAFFWVIPQRLNFSWFRVFRIVECILQFPPHIGELFLTSNFRRVLNVVCFLLGNFPASEFFLIQSFSNSRMCLAVSSPCRWIIVFWMFYAFFWVITRRLNFSWFGVFRIFECVLQFPPHVGELFLISNFRRVMNVVCFLLGNSPASVAREVPRRKHTTTK